VACGQRFPGAPLAAAGWENNFAKAPEYIPVFNTPFV
jgi:hypothetical protein